MGDRVEWHDKVLGVALFACVVGNVWLDRWPQATLAALALYALLWLMLSGARHAHVIARIDLLESRLELDASNKRIEALLKTPEAQAVARAAEDADRG